MKSHGWLFLSLFVFSSLYAQTKTAPTVQFGNQDFKVVYVGIENHFCFVAEGVAANKITLEAEGAQLKKIGNSSFSIQPTIRGDVKVLAFTEINKKKTQVGSITLIAKQLPDPTAMLMFGANKMKMKGGTILKTDLIKNAQIVCIDQNGADSTYTVISFSMMAVGHKTLTVKGPNLNVEFINKLSADDILVISNIIVVGADKITKHLNTLAFKFK